MSTVRLRRFRRRGERGVNIVEFALVVPVFLAFVFGLTELGRAVWYYNTLSNAAREGARYGIVIDQNLYRGSNNGVAPGTYTASSYSGTSTIAGRAGGMAGGLDLSQLTVTVTLKSGDNGGLVIMSGAPITVTVNYSWQSWVPAIVGGNSSINLQASSSMLLE
jgi:Flp pilus assembly protein TadG